MGESNHKGWQGSTPPSLCFLYFLHVVSVEMLILVKPVGAYLLVTTGSTRGEGFLSQFPTIKIQAR